MDIKIYYQEKLSYAIHESEQTKKKILNISLLRIIIFIVGFIALCLGNDVPELDTENSEHISDFDYAYQYVLNMGYNSECEKEKGFAFFFHCFRVNRTYTGGCVGVPENIMKFVMQHIKPGCKITIDSLENMGGDLDA